MIDFAKEYLKDLVRKGLSEERIKKYKSILKKMCILNLDPRIITGKEIDRFFFHLIEQGYSDESRRDYWVCFKRIVLFFQPEMYSVFENYRVKVRYEKGLVLTKDEIRTMISHTKSIRNKLIISILYEGALRMSELIGIERNDVVFDEHGAIITVVGKTGPRRIRIVRCVAELKELFKNALKPFDLSKSFIGTSVVKKTAILANVRSAKKVSPMVLRRSRATHLARDGLHIIALKRFLGHAFDSKATCKYVNFSMRDFDDQILSIARKEEYERARKRIWNPELIPVQIKQTSVKNVVNVSVVVKDEKYQELAGLISKACNEVTQRMVTAYMSSGSLDEMKQKCRVVR